MVGSDYSAWSSMKFWTNLINEVKLIWANLLNKLKENPLLFSA